MMSPEDRAERQRIFYELSKPLPHYAVEHAPGSKTRKKYDATFYKYIYIADRFNKVLGFGGWRYRGDDLQIDEGETSTGRHKWIATLRVIIEYWNNGEWVMLSESYQTNDSMEDPGNAIKGAMTGGFKKAAANIGVGWQTYADLLDPDNPLTEDKQSKVMETPKEPEPTPWEKAGQSIMDQCKAAGIDGKTFSGHIAKNYATTYKSLSIEQCKEVYSHYKKLAEEKLKEAQKDTVKKYQMTEIPEEAKTTKQETPWQEKASRIFNDPKAEKKFIESISKEPMEKWNEETQTVFLAKCDLLMKNPREIAQYYK